LVHQLAATNVFAVGDRVRVALARSLYARCDLLIAVSPWIAARLNALGAPTVVVAPGVDRVAPRPPLAPGGAARVLCVANWIPNKRVLDLVDAFARLTEDAATLRLIGAQHPETRYGRAVARRIRRDDVRVRVHAPGTLERDGVAREYAAADIFALPSRDEAYGIAFAEALASGLPVVGYDSGYPPALVGEAGAFVRPGDVEALAWALSLIALDGDLRAAMSAQALARASALPTWDESATALFAALRSGIRIAPVRERGERDRAASGS
jgi:glycosyltransferase involved in cell wall biosynthesis